MSSTFTYLPLLKPCYAIYKKMGQAYSDNPAAAQDTY